MTAAGFAVCVHPKWLWTLWTLSPKSFLNVNVAKWSDAGPGEEENSVN